MSCKNMVDQWVPRGPYGHGKTMAMKCGSTDIHGGTLLCDEPRTCPNQHSDGRPWYICKHGNDVSEYMCGACEFD